MSNTEEKFNWLVLFTNTNSYACSCCANDTEYNTQYSNLTRDELVSQLASELDLDLRIDGVYKVNPDSESDMQAIIEEARSGFIELEKVKVAKRKEDQRLAIIEAEAKREEYEREKLAELKAKYESDPS